MTRSSILTWRQVYGDRVGERSRCGRKKVLQVRLPIDGYPVYGFPFNFSRAARYSSKGCCRSLRNGNCCLSHSMKPGSFKVFHVTSFTIRVTFMAATTPSAFGNASVRM